MATELCGSRFLVCNADTGCLPKSIVPLAVLWLFASACSHAALLGLPAMESPHYGTDSTAVLPTWASLIKCNVL